MADSDFELENELLGRNAKKRKAPKRAELSDDGSDSDGDFQPSEDSGDDSRLPVRKRHKGKAAAARGSSDDDEENDLYEDEADEQKLAAMTELEREMILAERAERRNRARQRAELLQETKGKGGKVGAPARLGWAPRGEGGASGPARLQAASWRSSRSKRERAPHVPCKARPSSPPQALASSSPPFTPPPPCAGRACARLHAPQGHREQGGKATGGPQGHEGTAGSQGAGEGAAGAGGQAGPSSPCAPRPAPRSTSRRLAAPGLCSHCDLAFPGPAWSLRRGRWQRVPPGR
jgi:RNA polymerase-associated protein RTF1